MPDLWCKVRTGILLVNPASQPIAVHKLALREIDFRTIGEGRMGPVTREVQQAFRAAIHGEHPRSAEWLDYVNTPAAVPVREAVSV